MLKIYSKKYSILFCFIIVLLTACKTYFPATVQSDILKIKNTDTSDASIFAYYKSYKDSLDKLMKVPVADLALDLSKNKPESTLGNMMADILLKKTKDYYGDKIDFAIVNYGGIRIPTLSKGALQIEDAYFLMPFDNYLVVQKLTGQQVQYLCDSIAATGGWPIAGMSFQILDNKASNIKINNTPLQLNSTYTMATSDYLANGGDGLNVLKSIPAIETGKLYRDAIIDYWKAQTNAGKQISSQLENRITNAPK